ncbi:MAG: DUF5074 domain-containing protein [Cytophagales bacterium]
MKIFSWYILVFIFFACNPPKRETLKIAQLKPGKIIILNEGGFTYDNASLDIYNPDTDSIFNNQFEAVNLKKLGDVAQSISKIDGNLWIVVNNSGKIFICDTSLKILKEITGLNSPRYACKVSNEKIYVTDLYANSIHIFNAKTFEKSGNIPLKGWSEELIRFNDSLVIVTNMRSNYLYFLNSSSDRIVDSLKVSIGGSSLKKDKFGFVWVACQGDEKTAFSIYRLDILKKEITKTWRHSKEITFNPKLCFNPTLDTLYWIESGLKRNTISSLEYPAQNFYNVQNTNLYGLGIDSSRNEIYVLDAKDFNQNGEMLRLNTNGTLISKKRTGVIPNGILPFF